ncbi:type I toxin-antitoxin system Ibs family toxin, partial [Escherichia coli]
VIILVVLLLLSFPTY